MNAAVIAAAHGPCAPDAVALAADLARLHDACVVIAGVYVVPGGPYAEAYAHSAREALRQELDGLCDAIPSDVPHTAVVRPCSSVVRGLREMAESDHAQAIVLGATHRGTLGRLLHGDVTAGLLHGAPCAIGIAPRGWASEGRRLGEHVVGVAWDDGPEGQPAVDEAVRIATHTGCVVRLLHVVEPLPTSAELSWLEDDALTASRHERAQALIDEVAAQLRDRCLVETVVVDGPAAPTLTAASEKLDLLVVGSRAYGPVLRVLFGSVSTRLAHAAACPVLVLPRRSHHDDDGAGAGSDATRATG